MIKSISRRDFMKGMAVGCVALGSASLLAACGSSDSASEESTEEAAEETSASDSDTIIDSGDTNSPSNSTVYSDDDELNRAFSWGLVLEEWSADTLSEEVTCGDFCQLLSNAIGLCDSAAAASFEAEVAAQMQEDGPIYDFDQLMAIYTAACALGIGQETNGDWNSIQEVSRDWTWSCLSDYFIDDRHKIAPFYDVAYTCHCPEWTYDVASRFWVYGQFSAISGKTILEYEPLLEGETREDAPTMEDTPMTRDEAIRAAVRFYESTLSPIVADATNVEATAIYDEVETRRETILNSQTTIVKADNWKQGKTYSGTAFYVSNSGDDNNDGLSPETPWQSLEKVSNADLQPGDAVFFCRGDVWYNETGEEICVWGKSGVTYSAYGEGEKPIISGSIPDIANEENWSLYSDMDQALIWVYKDMLCDVSGVFMNDNTVWAEKVQTGWDGENYLNADGTLFVLEESLNEDLSFVSLLDISGQPADATVESMPFTGPLYLRCDEGNPGLIFSDIQFAQAGIGVGLEGYNGSGATIDNLCIIYHATVGVSLSGYQGWSDTLVQNCEIGWCGGELQAYSESVNLGYGLASYSGAAIQMSGCDNRAVNNYIHDCDNKGIAVAIHYRGEDITTSYENLEISSNLFERNGATLHLMNCLDLYNTDREGAFRNIVFEDNYVMNTGEGWIEKKIIKEDFYKNGGVRASINAAGISDAIVENVQICNNIFGCSAYTFVTIVAEESEFPIFSGNTYMQYENGWTARVNGRMLAVTEGGAEAIDSGLGDDTARIIIMN